MAPTKETEVLETEGMAAVPAADAAPEVMEEAPKKTAAKKTTARKTTKKAAEAAEAGEEKPAKKTTARKTTKKAAEAAEAGEEKPAKKTTRRTKKTEAVTTVYVQYAGKEAAAGDLVAAAKEAYLAAGHKEEDIKTFDVYVKPEENAVYYVVNGEAEADYRIFY